MKKSLASFVACDKKYLLARPGGALLCRAKKAYLAGRARAVERAQLSVPSLHERVVQFDLWDRSRRHHYADAIGRLRRWSRRELTERERALANRDRNHVTSLAIAAEEYEKDTAEAAGLAERRALIAAATITRAWSRTKEPAFSSPADFLSRLRDGDEVALAAERVMQELGL